MPPPASTNNNPKVPVLPKQRTGIAIVDTLLGRIVDILNPVLALGTTMIQGKPIPAPVPANDGQSVQWDAKAQAFVYSGPFLLDGSVPLASDTTIGITKISVAPVLAADPIAVGDNDPRNANARAPTGAAGGALTGSYPNPPLAAVIAPTGPVGDSTHVATVTVNAAGQVTSLTPVLIAAPATPPIISATRTQFFDDFYGAVIPPAWVPVVNATGTVGIMTPAGAALVGFAVNGCGAVDLFTPANGDWSGIGFDSGFSFANDVAFPYFFVGSIEWCASWGGSGSAALTNRKMGLGTSIATVQDKTGPAITIGWDSQSASKGVLKVYVNLGDGFGDHVFSPGSPILIDSTIHTYTIKFTGNGTTASTVTFLFDGVDTGISIASVGYPSAFNQFLQPIAFMENTSGGGTAATAHTVLDYFAMTAVRPLL